MNSRVAERIAQPDRLGELEQEMVDGDLYGMQTFDQSLVHLYHGGLVDACRRARARRPNRAEMRFELDRADFERGGAPTRRGRTSQAGDARGHARTRCAAGAPVRA